jgi:hypothetical protein
MGETKIHLPTVQGRPRETDEASMFIAALGPPVLTLANALTWSLVAVHGALLFS